MQYLDENTIIVGDENYQKDLFLNGLSFAEEIIELISGPYINFVLAGASDTIVKEFGEKHKDNLLVGHIEDYSNIAKRIYTNFSGIYFCEYSTYCF